MPDMIHTKLFRTGGSVALRIPAGWLDPARPVDLFRDPHTGRVYATQDSPVDTQDFFDFVRGKNYLPDEGFSDLTQRHDPPRPSVLSDEDTP